MTVNLASTKTRKNLCSNPSFEVDASGWTYTLGGAAIARSTARASVGGLASGLVTWATAAAGAQAEGIVVSGLTNGQSYTVSADVFVPATMPRVNIDALGLTASTPSSVNGAWQRLSFTFTASAATATIRLVCNDAGAAGQTANIDRVLVESGSVVGTYFDGDTANGWWDGAAGTSTSEQVVPAGLNPNQPLLGWRVWTGENPPSVPNSPTTVPLVLSDRARSFKIERGRQYELDQDQTGTASVTLQNDDGALIGGQNNMYPGRLGEFRVTYQGVNYTLYTGYVASWPDKASDPATSQANLDFVDLMEALARRPLGSLYRETTLAASPAPTHFFPFDENARSSALGTVGAIDALGGNGSQAYPVVAYKGGDPGTLVFGGAGLCTSDASTSLSNDNATGATGKASQIRLGGPGVAAGSGVSIDTTQPWLVLFILKSTAGKTSVFSILDNAGNEFASLFIDMTGTGTGTWIVGGCTSPLYATPEIKNTGEQVGLGWDGTNAFLMYAGSKTVITGTYVPKGVLNWIAAGASFNGTTIFHGSNSTYQMQYLAMWSGSSGIPDLTSSGPIYDMYHAFADGYLYCNVPLGSGTSFDFTDVRMGRVLKWAGQGGLTGEKPQSNIDAMPDTKGAAALDVLRQAALSVWGRFFISKSGLPTFHSKDWKQSQITPSWVFGSNTAAGELPYTGSPEFQYDLAHTYNDVQVTSTSSVVNPNVVPAAVPGSVSTYQKGSTYRWVNTTSVGKYFTRVLQASMGLLFGTDTINFAQYLANRYGEPDYRIGDIVLDPIGNPALWPAVLSLELDDVVQVNHRDLHTTRSAWYQVAKITHEVDGGDAWRTTLALTPFHQYWLLAAMHTTLASACLAGATSISINPLPDSATNPAEASLGVGTKITLEPGTSRAETVTINSVASVPTPRVAGYTSITVGITATTYAHAANTVACDPLPSGVTDPTTWDARSVLGTTTVLTA